MRRLLSTVTILFCIAISIFSEDLGMIVKYPDGGGNTWSGSKINLKLEFSLQKAQYYEFGFTNDSSIKLGTAVTAIENLPLAKDDAESVNGALKASADFSVYWKIVSGYPLSLYLEASGPFTRTAGGTVGYSLLGSDNTVILGDGRGNNTYNTDAYKDRALMLTYKPDYDKQVFSDADVLELRIITNDIDNAFANENSSYSTVFTLSLEVQN